MGEVKIPEPVKLICGLLASSRDWLDRGKNALVEKFGPLDLESEIIPFNFTAYYNEEMGEGILRQWAALEKLIEPGEIAAVKLATNTLEGLLGEEGRRGVNLDPGYLDLSKLILATTKDATYRVYLSGGISAQPTLFFQDGSFRPWRWTYPDYASQTAIYFFNDARKIYKEQLRKRRKK